MANVIEDAAVKLIRLAATKLPADVKSALQKAYREEKTKIGKMELEAIIENVRIAEKTESPLCQDTGVVVFYVTIGDRFDSAVNIPKALKSAVRRATLEVPLRSNIVNPFSRKNTGDNVGLGIPIINWNFTPGNSLELTTFLKGAGSENMCALTMLHPTEGIVGIKKFVINTVVRAGGQPCPPTIIGVGIGGSAEVALSLAEKALLRPVNKRNKDRIVAKLENDLLSAINATGIGPMGLGGRSTALGVNVEYVYCHTASLPVAVNIGCWCNRRATCRINRSGTITLK